MFKTTLTAAAFALIAGLANAANPLLILSVDAASSSLAVEGAAQFEQVNHYCEWVTLYDAWGNWVTVWQCY